MNAERKSKAKALHLWKTPVLTHCGVKAAEIGARVAIMDRTEFQTHPKPCLVCEALAKKEGIIQ